MKETNMWRKLDPHLSRIGKFQKICDRFTGGIPDILGARTGDGRGVALELKELDGVKLVKARYRPGQLDWLEDWSSTGAIALVVATWRREWMAFEFEEAEKLEEGLPPDQLQPVWRRPAEKLIGLRFSQFIMDF